MNIRLKIAMVGAACLVALMPSIAATARDYDGDGKADIAVFRPSIGTWFIIPSANPSALIVRQWGTQGDIPVPGDYDGDGKTDIAVFRPSSGTWFILPSSKPGTFIIQQWGAAGDIPVPGDYDGDGKTDIAVFRPSSGTWFILPSSKPGTFIIQQWGTAGDIPVPGDYDSDGKTDFGVFRSSNGTWYVIPSSNPSAPIVRQWGTQGDIPVPADYDGDGKTDFAVFRPSNGEWYIIPTGNPNAPIFQQWGTQGDIPVPADYDRDRKTDLAVWRPSNGVWFIIPSSAPSTFTITQWGTNGDVPVQEPSGSIPVPSTIASASLFISASQGGSIYLPDGSNVMIPPGALATSQTVSISEMTILPKQPPNPHIVGVGTSLVLSLSTPNPTSHLLAAQTSTHSNAAAGTSSTDLVFTIAEPLDNSLQGSAPMSDLVDNSGTDNFIGASGSFSGGTAQSTIPASLLGGVPNIAVSQANTVPEPPPQYGPRSLSGSTWGPYSCPSGNVLVMVHGIFSRVEKAFPAETGCAANIQKNGLYDQVVGFDYDFLQHIDDSGSQLAGFLNTLAQCPAVDQIDVEGHSEGVAVSIAAGAKIAPMTVSKMNEFVFEAGPRDGTPIASTVQNFLTGLFSLPGVENNLPLLDEFGAAMQDLTPGNSVLVNDRLNFAINLPNVREIGVAGNVPILPEISDGSIFPLGTPNDGIVATGSALPSGSAFPNETQLPVFSDKHTQLECDPQVQSAVGAQLALDIHPTSLTFVASGGSNPPSQALMLHNQKAIAWFATPTTSGSGSWLAVSPTLGDTQNNPSVTVSVDASQLAAGSYSGSIGFTANPNMNVSVTTQVPVNLTVSSQDLSGVFTGTVVSDSNGPCPGSASESGTITGTLSPSGNPQIPLLINITWAMTQGSGICHSYGGSYNLLGSVDPSGNVIFAYGTTDGSFAIAGSGTLSKGTITGTWGMSAEYPGSSCNQNVCVDLATGGSFTMSVQ